MKISLQFDCGSGALIKTKAVAGGGKHCGTRLLINYLREELWLSTAATTEAMKADERLILTRKR